MKQLSQLMERFQRESAAFDSWCDTNRVRILDDAEAHPQRCDRHAVPLTLDVDASLEATYRRADDRTDLVFTRCEHCLAEATRDEERARWLALGIPERVVDATVKGFLIPDSDRDLNRDRDRSRPAGRRRDAEEDNLPGISDAGPDRRPSPAGQSLARMRAYRESIRDWVTDDLRPTFVLLSGKPGAGKSHMAASCLKHFHNAGCHGAWIRWADLVREHRRGYNEATRSGAALEIARTKPFLVIDDVTPSRAADEFEIWTEIVNARHDARRPTIITTNETLDSFHVNCLSHKGAIDRVRSDSLQILCDWPSYRETTL